MIRRLRYARDLDLLVTAALAVASVPAVALAVPEPLRFVLALPLVLALPGYSLLMALLPDNALPALDRVLIGGGASLALSILVGIVLGISPLGLGPLTWALGLSLPTVVLCGVAWWRRQGGTRLPTGTTTPVALRPLAILGVTTVAVIGILVATRAIAARVEPLPPVQLWMLPAGPDTTAAMVGVRGGEPVGEYLIRLTSAGALLYEFRVTLGSGETWQELVPLTQLDRQRPVVARLYHVDDLAEIRFVVLQPMIDGG